MTLIIKTAEDLQEEAREAYRSRVSAAVDQHIEAQARAMQYNSAAHLASYVSSTVPSWRAEAHAFVAWRDACWVGVLGLLAQAQSGGGLPSMETVINELPQWEVESEE